MNDCDSSGLSLMSAGSPAHLDLKKTSCRKLKLRDLMFISVEMLLSVYAHGVLFLLRLSALHEDCCCFISVVLF